MIFGDEHASQSTGAFSSSSCFLFRFLFCLLLLLFVVVVFVQLSHVNAMSDDCRHRLGPAPAAIKKAASGPPPAQVISSAHLPPPLGASS